jgi:hypothetical protein
VIGAALGSKVSDGIDTGEICLTVFVRRKHRAATLERQHVRRLPKALRRGNRSLPVDVVEIGRLERQAFPGGTCSVTNGLTRTGTVGAPAVTPGGGQVFITAMHVTGASEISAASGVTLQVNAPSRSDVPSAPIVGHVVQGSRSGIDAAKVMLANPHTVTRLIPILGRICGWRPVAFPADKDIPVAMFGGVSSVRHIGAIVHPAAFVPSFGLDSAITVRGFTTVEGDSGAALIDSARLVLGFLVGAAGGLRIFCPASLVLKRLGCDIPTILD